MSLADVRSIQTFSTIVIHVMLETRHDVCAPRFYRAGACVCGKKRTYPLISPVEFDFAAGRFALECRR